ncbi:MAG TPA: hypothetical protein VLA49_10495 [Anaerolineales bacterium]|nr:hypothetical protein [Anaerolineales bacterium]
MRVNIKRLALALIGLSLLITGCPVKVERLQISVQEDLSSSVQIIFVESNGEYERQIEKGEQPDLENYKNKLVDCDFEIKDYNAKIDYKGYLAKAEFKSKGELEYAWTCIRELGLAVTLRPLKVTDGLFGTYYEIQIEINEPWFVTPDIHEVRVTLPGKMDLVTPDDYSEYYLNNRLEGVDTVVWDILPPGPDHPTIDRPIYLIARSRKTKIRFEWIISFLGLLFGSGFIWQVLKTRRKTSAKDAQ